MPKIAYQEKKFRVETLALINLCNDIIRQYMAQGYTLTLRQLYYQLVSREIIPNTERDYKRLGSIVNDARLAGLIDWDAIEDRGRNQEGNTNWHSPDQIIEAAYSSYRRDWWEGQEYRPRVWVEKAALLGVVAPICLQLDVPYYACRGYNSQSEQWRSGREFLRDLDRGQAPVVLHFGDHDPSGIDMTRDNTERLAMFAGRTIIVKRIALNMDQIKQYAPPPNPAKTTDSRFLDYSMIYGDESWELDALDPPVIAGLIRAEVEQLINFDVLREVQQRERTEKAKLRVLFENWDDIQGTLTDYEDA